MFEDFHSFLCHAYSLKVYRKKNIKNQNYLIHLSERYTWKLMAATRAVLIAFSYSKRPKDALIDIKIVLISIEEISIDAIVIFGPNSIEHAIRASHTSNDVLIGDSKYRERKEN